MIFLLDAKQNTPLLTIEDPRSPHELIQAINTGSLGVGEDGLKPQDQRQWAMPLVGMDAVIVTRTRPRIFLSPRQYEVLCGLAEGLPAKQIASRLGIRLRTVYWHIEHLKRSLHARNRSQAVAIAVELGLMPVVFQVRRESFANPDDVPGEEERNDIQPSN